MALTEKQENAIVLRLMNTSIQDLRICDDYEVDLEDVEEVMVNAGWERCSVCDVWTEVGSLNADDECESCADRDEDDKEVPDDA